MRVNAGSNRKSTHRELATVVFCIPHEETEIPEKLSNFPRSQSQEMAELEYRASPVLETAIVKCFPGEERAARCRGRGEVQNASNSTRWKRSHLLSRARWREGAITAELGQGTRRGRRFPEEMKSWFAELAS